MGKLLDTDFVVGTALLLFKGRGFDCIWQHVAEDPREERNVCKQFKPLLQSNGTTIDRRFRFAKSPLERWCGTDVQLAEQRLMAVFEAAFPVGLGQSRLGRVDPCSE
jgi:hypothetical protein